MKRLPSRWAVLVALTAVAGLLEVVPLETLRGQVVACIAFPQGCYKTVPPPCSAAVCAAATPAMAQTFCDNGTTHPVYYSGTVQTGPWYSCSLLKGSGKKCEEYNDGACLNIYTYDFLPCNQASRCSGFILYKCIADVGIPCP